MPGLFDPFAIKGLTIKNRIVMPPMANNMANERGEVTDRHIRHYSSRAEANVGFIMVEHTYVQRNGRANNTQLGIWDDSLVSGLRTLADTIHEAGAAAGIQITHVGSRTTSAVIGEQPVSPSGVLLPGDKEQSRPLAEEEIQELVANFAKGARRAVEAGFDSVEVHSAHGFLLCQFLSPLTNQRSDRYGGDLDGRLTIHREVIGAIRKLVGENYPLFCRLGADDLTPGGTTPEDGQQAAKELVKAGIDLIDVSGGLGGSGSNRFTEQGYFVPLSESIKKAANVPVIGVGNIRDPEYADQVVREGRIDLVAIGRALLSDPLWAQKAAEKLGAKIRK